jgi:perosamine synthetase
MNSINFEQVTEGIRSVWTTERPFAPLHEPQFVGNEWEYVKSCIDSGWVSSAGPFVDLFEKKLAEYAGVRRAVAVVNGTAALHLALIAAGVQEGDEVLTPAFTFVATANAVSYCRAINHFVDIEEKTLGIDPWKLSQYLSEIAEIKEGGCFNRLSGRRIKAVVPMHTFGHPVDLDPLIHICEKYGIVMIEDAAEGIGSYYKNRHVGSFGAISVLSFNGNKIITTGGGGAVLTNDDQVADYIKHISTTAKIPHSWNFVHDQIGYNYRMPNINAALGCAQLEQLPSFLQSKRQLAEGYRRVFAKIEGMHFFSEPEFATSNYWLNAIILEPTFISQRDKLLEMTNQSQIMTRPAWTLMHLLPMYNNHPRMDLTISEDIAERLINIPSSANLIQQ